MNAGAILTLASFLAIAAINAGAQDSPADRLAALVKDFNARGGNIRKAITDRERREAVEGLGALAAEFLDLAERFPEDPIALQALRQAIQTAGTTDSQAQVAWETNRSDFPGGCNDGSPARTVTLLLRDHLSSDAIGPICDRLRYSYRLETEEFLRAVLEKNPHREMRGAACLYLARYLNDKLRMAQLAADRPELEQCYGIVFGEDYLPALRRLEKDGLAERIEALFERAATEYADVAIPVGGTVGEQAESELYDIRHLAVGMPAPGIEGRDQDGVEFRLEDYLGKVVLLYFWVEF